MSKSGDSMKSFLDSFPEGFKKMFRMEDYFSGPGFLNTELFSLIIPMVMIGVGLAWGAGATADDEERGTADLIFALPITRSKILWSRLLAMISALGLLAVINFINLMIGARFVDMQLTATQVAAGSLGCFLIGMLFASLGALLGALSGKRGASLGIGSGLAILFYVFYTLTALVTRFDFIKPINPFQWLIEANQLIEGFKWSTNFKFLVLSAISALTASWIINRRDIHSN